MVVYWLTDMKRLLKSVDSHILWYTLLNFLYGIIWLQLFLKHKSFNFCVRLESFIFLKRMVSYDIGKLFVQNTKCIIGYQVSLLYTFFQCTVVLQWQRCTWHLDWIIFGALFGLCDLLSVNAILETVIHKQHHLVSNFLYYLKAERFKGTTRDAIYTLKFDQAFV